MVATSIANLYPCKAYIVIPDAIVGYMDVVAVISHPQ